jgi:hypothetical protein
MDFLVQMLALMMDLEARSLRLELVTVFREAGAQALLFAIPPQKYLAA